MVENYSWTWFPFSNLINSTGSIVLACSPLDIKFVHLNCLCPTFPHCQMILCHNGIDLLCLKTWLYHMSMDLMISCRISLGCHIGRSFQLANNAVHWPTSVWIFCSPWFMSHRHGFVTTLASTFYVHWLWDISRKFPLILKFFCCITVCILHSQWFWAISACIPISFEYLWHPHRFCTILHHMNTLNPYPSSMNLEEGLKGTI